MMRGISISREININCQDSSRLSEFQEDNVVIKEMGSIRRAGNYKKFKCLKFWWCKELLLGVHGGLCLDVFLIFFPLLYSCFRSHLYILSYLFVVGLIVYKAIVFTRIQISSCHDLVTEVILPLTDVIIHYHALLPQRLSSSKPLPALLPYSLLFWYNWS